MNGSSVDSWSVDQAKEFLSLRMSQMHSYHDHKETMAHAALLVQLAIAGGVLSMNPWPPQWLAPASLCSKALATAAVLTIAVLVHVYMRWQLQRRRSAALYVATILKVFLEWGYRAPTDNELKPWRGLASHPDIVDRVLDLIVPWKAARVLPDEGLVDYPAGFVAKLSNTQTGAVQAEGLVTYGSILIMIIIFARGLW